MRNRTGLGNYSRFVVSLLQRYASAWEFYLASPDVGNESLYASLLTGHGQTKLLLPKHKWLSKIVPFYRQYWRTSAMVNELNPLALDLYVGLSNELPVTAERLRCPTIVTIHDLIYERHPEFYKPIDVKLYREKYRRSCHLASRIVAVSERTKQDVMELYGVPESRISVLYQGCDAAFRLRVSKESIARVRACYALPERYILSVGTVEVRKNAILLVEALSLLKDKNVHLVVAGGLTKYAALVQQRAEELGLSSRVHIIGAVPLSMLPALYQAAQVFCYPSFYEGFGIPILEALCSSVPVVAASGSCLEESGGPHSLYALPKDADAFAEKIDRVLADSELRSGMVEGGLLWSERFLPEHLVKPLMQVYEEVARDGGGHHAR